MQTKLNRIDGLMRAAKEVKYSDSSYSKLQNELEDHFGELKDENSELEDRVRKLRVVYQALNGDIKKGGTTTSMKSSVGAAKRKTSTVGSNRTGGSKVRPQTAAATAQPILSQSMSMSLGASHTMTPQQFQLIEQLRLQMKTNERTILQLRSEKEKIQHLNPNQATTQLTQDDLLRKIRERDSEIREISQQVESLNLDFIKKEKIFNESKAYMEQVLKDIHSKRLENQTLSQKNMRLHIQVQQSTSLQNSLKDLDSEKAAIENTIRRITSEPFLN